MGCGPCGELRYPAYPEANGWRFPVGGRLWAGGWVGGWVGGWAGRGCWRLGRQGWLNMGCLASGRAAASTGAPSAVFAAADLSPTCPPACFLARPPACLPCLQGVGEFQCYDRRALASLAAAAREAGHPEWGNTGGCCFGGGGAGAGGACACWCNSSCCSCQIDRQAGRWAALVASLSNPPAPPLQARMMVAATTPRPRRPASSAAGGATGRRPMDGEPPLACLPASMHASMPV